MFCFIFIVFFAQNIASLICHSLHSCRAKHFRSCWPSVTSFVDGLGESYIVEAGIRGLIVRGTFQASVVSYASEITPVPLRGFLTVRITFGVNFDS
jgi:hypothetical protein